MENYTKAELYGQVLELQNENNLLKEQLNIQENAKRNKR